MPNAAYAAIGNFNQSAVDTAWAPPPHVAGQILVLVVESQETGVPLGTPVGWNIVPNMPRIQGSNVLQLSGYWRRATSDHMPNVQITDPGNHLHGVIFTVDDAQWFGDPWDNTAVGSNNNTAAIAPAISTTAINELVVAFFAQSNDTATVQISGVTNANLSGLTVRGSEATTVGGGGGLVIATGTKATIGSVGNTTATIVSQPWAAFQGALKNDLGTSYDGPEVVAVGAANANVSGFDVTYTLPSHSAGDRLFLFTETAADAGTPDIITATGWTKWQVLNAFTLTTTLTVYTKVATSSSETNPVVPSATNHQSGFAISVSDSDATGSWSDFTPVTSVGNGAAIAVSAATATQDHVLVITVITNAQDTATPQVSANNDDLPYFQEIGYSQHTQGSGGGIAVWIGKQHAAGSTGAVAARQTTGRFAALTFGVRKFSDTANFTIGLPI